MRDAVKLSLNRSEAEKASWLDQGLARKLQRIVASLEPRRSTVDLIVVGDGFIRKLNRAFRGQDRPTDVLSFSYLTPESTPTGEHDHVAGEVYVSYETLEEDAKRRGVDPRNLFLRLGIHGMLHVVGHEHDSDSDAQVMENEERRLLLGCLEPEAVDELF